MHAVGRIAYRGWIDNIQASWVKIGVVGARQILQAGANDLGGTLMDENISRAVGASHGQELDDGDAVPSWSRSAVRSCSARRFTVASRPWAGVCARPTITRTATVAIRRCCSERPDEPQFGTGADHRRRRTRPPVGRRVVALRYE